VPLIPQWPFTLYVPFMPYVLEVLEVPHALNRLAVQSSYE
jgi:hypothetical protein